jgi:hypothetical protein
VRAAGVPEGRSLRWPFLSVQRDTAWISGNLFPTSATGSVGARAMAVLRIPGGPISLPDGDFVFAYPRGLKGADGRYHLVWGETATKDVPLATWPGPRIGLWHSTFDGRVWSRPQRVLDGLQLGWGPSFGGIAIDGKGVLHVALAAVVRAGESILAHIRVDQRGSSIQELPGPAASVVIAAVGAEGVVIGYVGNDPMRPQSRVLAIRRSNDGGATWGNPQSVRIVPREQSIVNLTLSSSETRVGLFWTEGAGPLTPQSVHLLRSSDAGRSWTQGTNASLPTGQILAIAAAVRSCTEPAVVTSSYDGSRLWLHELDWRGDSAVFRVLFERSPLAGNPALTEIDGKLSLVFTESTVHAPVSLVRRDCASRKP